jgi:hypothetical protein
MVLIGSNPRISLDLDGVCADNSGILVEVMKKEFGRVLTPDEYIQLKKEESVDSVSGKKFLEFEEHLNDAYYAHLASFPAMEECAISIEALRSQGKTIRIHTWRPDIHRGVSYNTGNATKKWLRDNRIQADVVVCETSEEKVLAIINYSPAVHVDDSVKIHTQLAAMETLNGCQPMRKIYFQNVYNPIALDMETVYSWRELSGKI